MKLLKAAAFAVALIACAPMAACQTAGAAHTVDHATAQKAMIDCDTFYVAIATIADAHVLPADKQALADDIKAKAWSALQVARALYAANQSPSIATLAALVLQAQALAGGAH